MVTEVEHQLKIGANVNAIDEDKNTPLHLIGWIQDAYNQHVIADLLVKAGANVQFKNAYDKTPIDLAMTNESNVYNFQ